MDNKKAKVLIIGNPNVGKSLIFSRLTGSGVVSANYSGSTVEIKKGKCTVKDKTYEVIDVPGIYSLQPFSDSDAVATALIADADLIINVLDSTNLERNLNLTLSLTGKNIPMIVCLNFWDEAPHKGVSINKSKLEELLGVPVVPTSALSGEGLSELADSLNKARIPRPQVPADSSWEAIGIITSQVQQLSHRHHTLLEKISDFMLHPIGGTFSALAILITTFSIVRFLGESLITSVGDPLYNKFYSPLILSLVNMIPVDFVRLLLIGSNGVAMESFGVLTTGAYIAVVLVLPYFFSFYLMLGLLEDVGYLPRLAITLDNLFHKIGLHGHSAIPVMLGLGCKVPAFLSTRLLATKREKIITISLILMSAPCMPQSAMIISLGMKYGVGVVLAIYAVLLVLAVFCGWVLSKFLKGEDSELFLEIPPYRLPSIRFMADKLRLRIGEYLTEAFPMILAGVLVINLLDHFMVIDWVVRHAGGTISSLLGLPPQIASVMILGFLRKDVSIALLAPFHLSARQFIVAAIFMVLYLPCIASFFTLLKELGIKSTIAVVGFVFVCAVGVAAGLNLVMNFFKVF